MNSLSSNIPAAQERASRVIAFAIAVTCGVLLGMAVELVLPRLSVSGSWRDVLATNASAFRAALGWWAIGGTGLLGSLLAGLLLGPAPRRSRHRRRLQWLIGTPFVLLLAAVPYFAAVRPAADLSFSLATDLAAFGLAAVTACCGGWFAGSQ